ncbi:MAG: TrmH family RNA methyltransferase [Anaerolineae bacterium]|jgi:tRNA (guanosine-2'-O-)-methyltransferase|nr:RNA methyltransferase [Ardenticatenia bacterium]HRA20104.1 RNA methyltransferase [Anaerolineae bacterium]
MSDDQKPRISLRLRADRVRGFRCRHLIVVLENPADPLNIGVVIRNANALGVDKVYIVDEEALLPDDWQVMRQTSWLSKTSASAVKWSFVKTFPSTAACVAHLAKNGFDSVATSPHLKGRMNVGLEAGDFTPFKRLAVWFGNERQGLSSAALDTSRFCVNIPMFGIIESLNLGTSTGIVLYEVTKQRRAHQLMHWEKVVAKRVAREA